MTKSSEQILQLKNRIEELEEQLKYKNQLVFMLDEDIPESQNDRKSYMADIAASYALFFKKKFPHFISLQMEELAMIGRSELGNNIIRSNISCFRIMDEWMEQRTNEHLGNLEEARESLNNGKVDSEIINIKNKYKKL